MIQQGVLTKTVRSCTASQDNKAGRFCGSPTEQKFEHNMTFSLPHHPPYTTHPRCHGAIFNAVIRLFVLLCLLFTKTAFAEIRLLNVSYDPTREFYQAYNEMFASHWAAQTGETVRIYQSHGGSGKQARSVMNGLRADIVTLALSFDIDMLHKKSNLIDPNWQQRLPYRSSPYTSTIIFLVREGNPKNIQDWQDLIRPGVEVIIPNPKTSGGARWNYLAAWGAALKKNQSNEHSEQGDKQSEQGDEQQAFQFVKSLYQNVKVLDSSSRASLTTFQRGMGDVLVTWENEAFLAIKELEHEKFEIIAPKTSILAEPPVAMVDRVVDKKKTRAVAEAYLEYLYTEKAQTLAAQYYYRPRDPQVAVRYAKRFPAIELFTIDAIFGGWHKAQAIHFSDGGKFDQIYQTPTRAQPEKQTEKPEKVSPNAQPSL